MGLPGFPARVPTDSLPPGCSLRQDCLVGRDAWWTGTWCCPPHPVVRLRVAWCRAIQLLLSWGQESNNVQGQAGALGIYRGFRASSSAWGLICPVGNQEGPRGAGAASWPRLPHPIKRSPDHVDEAGGTFGGWPLSPPAPCLTRASFQLALPSAGPQAWPQPLPRMAAGVAPFSPPGAELLHISHQDSIGSCGWTWGEEEVGVSGTSGVGASE